MTNYYYMNREFGYLVKVEELEQDAIDCGYDDILDPLSALYDWWDEHYSKTAYVVE